MKPETEGLIKKMLLTACGVLPHELKPETRFKEDLNLDHLDMINFEFALQDEFGILVDWKEGQAPETYGKLISELTPVMDLIKL